MVKLISVLAIFFSSGLLSATEQEPDYLHYNGLELTVSIGWGHPSPLEIYYSQSNIEYPFSSMFNTANYRGHVAIWEISDGSFFLKEIQIEETKHKPEEFKVKSQSDSISYHDKVFADWFTGVIKGVSRSRSNYWKVEKTYYFYVKYGIVVESQELTEDDFNQIEHVSEKDTSNYDLMAKNRMLKLNNNYVSYYFRLRGSDTITLDTKGGYLKGNSGLSPVLLYYNNDHAQWPYNWENMEKSGAPFCTWIIDNDSLLLTNIEVHTGTTFYSIDRYSVDLMDIFTDRVIGNQVFGYWVSGTFYICHGENEGKRNLRGYYEFKETESTYLRVRNGIVLEKYTIPSDSKSNR